MGETEKNIRILKKKKIKVLPSNELLSPQFII